MILTKFEHACFTVEQDGQILVVDPGAYTTDFVVPGGVVAIVVTHEHADHFDTNQLAAIVAKSPDAIIVAHQSVTGQIDGMHTQSVASGDTVTIGHFELEFYGGNHAVIHPDIPVIANLGVMINSTIYYPGDSFIAPNQPIKVLALPVAAPWMKISEAVDFVRTVKPEMIFPTHDAILSDNGKGLPDKMIPTLIQNTDSKYNRLSEQLNL